MSEEDVEAILVSDEVSDTYSEFENNNDSLQESCVLTGKEKLKLEKYSVNDFSLFFIMTRSIQEE